MTTTDVATEAENDDDDVEEKNETTSAPFFAICATLRHSIQFRPFRTRMRSCIIIIVARVKYSHFFCFNSPPPKSLKLDFTVRSFVRSFVLLCCIERIRCRLLLQDEFGGWMDGWVVGLESVTTIITHEMQFS